MSNVSFPVRTRSAAPVVILASSRPDGNTFQLARLVLPEEAAPLVDLGALNISYYSYSHGNAADDFLPLVEELLVAPVWVLATPLYWYTLSAQAKTFMDRLTDLLEYRKPLGRQLRGKTLAVVCAGTDAQPPRSLEEPLELTARYLEMNYAGCMYAQFDERHLVLADAPEHARAFGRALVDEAAHPSIERTSSSKLRLLADAPPGQR